MANYEISAKLIIDNKQSKKAIQEAIKDIEKLNRTNSKYQKGLENQEKQQNKTNKTTDNATKSTDGLSKAVNSNNKAYKDLWKTEAEEDRHLRRLQAGLSEADKKNRKLNDGILNLHNSLKAENVSMGEANKRIRNFAKNMGLAYNGMNLISSNKNVGFSKDYNNNLTKLTKRTQTIGDVSKKAFETYTKKMAGLNTELSKGVISQSLFHKEVANVGKYMKGTYGVTVRQMGNGYSQLTSNTNSAKQALTNYVRELRSASALIDKGTFTPQARKRLATYRDTLGSLVMGQKEYNRVLSSAQTDKQGIKINVLKDIMGYMQKNASQLGINQTAINGLNTAYKRFNSNINKTGGSLADITGGTANYNKLLTTTTRSQRMQNYAMQVAGLRYNALATSLGFIGGMLGTQLAMGFATARIEAVQFEQKAQQMFKTSKLNAKGIESVTKAVREYTRENRKVNTQGLEYTVAQVTKLNNLNEEQSKKIIPVVADISNMMRINGRSQEDSILAVNDALDGQFKRLQEIGVAGKDMLKAYGWNGNVDDKMSLISALEKIGEKKGWSDLTKDISTLDDAYNVLGNTIDDVLTPAMVELTPTIVGVIQGVSGLVSGLWDAPPAIKGVATAIGVLGIAFTKMKFEMLYAKLIGSEFIARLTGLDAGMYGLTRSVGSVNMAVREEAISFEEGARCLMDYHTQQIGVSRTHREYTTILGELYTEQEALNVAMATATETEINELSVALEKNKARIAELIYMRDMETTYAKYILANNNLTASQRLQLHTIQSKAKLSDKEMAQIIAVNGLINENTKTIDINSLAKKLNVDITKKSNMALASSSPILRKVTKDTEAKKLSLLGLDAQKTTDIGLTELGITATQQDNMVKKVAKNHYNQLSEAQRKKISLNEIELIVKNNLNTVSAERVDALMMEKFAVNGCITADEKSIAMLQAKIIEEEIEIATQKNVAKAVNASTFAEQMHNNSLGGYIKNLAKSTKEMIKNAGASALMVAKFLLLTPEGWAVSAMLVALGISAHKTFVEMKKLNSSYEKFYKVQNELPEKITKLKEKMKELKDTNKDGKNDKEIEALQEKINYYDRLYKKVNAVVEKRSELEDNTEIGVSQQNERFYNRRRRKGGKPEEEYSDVDPAIEDMSKSSSKLEKLSEEQVKYQSNLDYLMDKNDISYEKAMGYAEESGEIFESLEQNIKDQNAEDWLTRVGGKWGEFFDRLELNWLNFKVNLPTVMGNVVDWIEKNNPFTSVINALLDPVEGDLLGTLEDWYKNMNPINLIYNFFNGIFDVTGAKDAIKKGIDTLSQSISDGVGDFNLLDAVTNAILPAPVSAEGTESTPFIESVFQRLGINPEMFDKVKKDLEDGFKGIIDKINWFINPANWFMGSDDSGDEGSTIVDTMYNNIVVPLTDTFNTIKESIYNKALGIGSRIKSGIRDGVTNLAQPIAQKLQELANYITSGQAVNDAKTNMTNLAKNLMDRFGKGIGDLSKIVSTEMDEIKNAIANKVDEIGALAEKVGSVINKGLRKGDDINSPGLAARAVLGEMNYVVSFISSAIPSISSISQKAGEAISNNFGQQDLTQNLEIIKNNQDIIKSNDMASQNTSAQYGNMADTVGNTFGVMSDNAVTDMNNVASENAQYLAQMNSDTSANMNQINKTHNDKLGTMQNTTMMATNSMTKAWGSMKNNIVNSATQIRNLSYQKFSSLHKSISSFYRQIQSATFSAGLVAGGYAGSPKRKSFSTARRTVRSGVAGGYAGRREDKDFTKLLKGLSKGTATNDDVVKFYNKYPIDCTDGTCYAGINPQTHVKKQLNYAHQWNIKDPAMYGIRLPMNNKVRDFDNGQQPRITYGNFEHYLGALLNERGFRGTYEFYFNSKRSNQQVWDDVRCNCFDGAELIMEIARDMGLSNVGMLHGDWKGIPHVCASVGGKIYDMTQFQNYGIFRGASGVSFGGAGGYAGKPIKWASRRFAGGTTNNTTNNKNNKVEVHITGNTFIGDEEYRKKMENIAEDVFYDKMGDNPCIGY